LFFYDSPPFFVSISLSLSLCSWYLVLGSARGGREQGVGTSGGAGVGGVESVTPGRVGRGGGAFDQHSVGSEEPFHAGGSWPLVEGSPFFLAKKQQSEKRREVRRVMESRSSCCCCLPVVSHRFVPVFLRDIERHWPHHIHVVPTASLENGVTEIAFENLFGRGRKKGGGGRGCGG
jgi:hypothetical protein